MEYQPDLAEEAWHASPEGLRSAARACLIRADELIVKAQALLAEAKAIERVSRT
jgi:hypothetical protein